MRGSRGRLCSRVSRPPARPPSHLIVPTRTHMHTPTKTHPVSAGTASRASASQGWPAATARAAAAARRAPGVGRVEGVGFRLANAILEHDQTP
jgi:hypothetical protein